MVISGKSLLKLPHYHITEFNWAAGSRRWNVYSTKSVTANPDVSLLCNIEVFKEIIYEGERSRK